MNISKATERCINVMKKGSLKAYFQVGPDYSPWLQGGRCKSGPTTQAEQITSSKKILANEPTPP